MQCVTQCFGWKVQQILQLLMLLWQESASALFGLLLTAIAALH